MRQIFPSESKKLHASVFAGTRAILIALNIDNDICEGLKGFAFKRSSEGEANHWLTGMKIFPSLVPALPKTDDKKSKHFPSNENPIQSFIWSDYEAKPATSYEFEVYAMYGQPGNLQARHTLKFEVTTEAEDDKHHGIWVNRGAIASQRFADKFGNKSLSNDEYDDINNEEVKWLSRGLLEACLKYINDTPSGDGLRVCAYEFTYQPVLRALNKARDRGVDVRIVYHLTSANSKAIQTAKLPAKDSGGQILFERTRPKTPHNKFIVRLKDGKQPIAVWTGSTNFTPSGFLGQTNVGHLVTDASIAKTYLELWTGLTKNPDSADAKENSVRLSPNPANIPPKGTSLVFSPRLSDRMLQWYGARVSDAATSAMFTGAFTVDPNILAPMAKRGPSMRFILLERPPTPEIQKARKDNAGDLMFSYGAVLGKMQRAEGLDADGKKTKKWVPIPNFKLDKWFIEEELERKTGQGFVFFIHTKFLLIDALSDDPLVCTGSANFSGESLKSNDENMLLIRGDTRVADIYLTEFDRIFRHFASRDAANEIAKDKGTLEFGLLDETDGWWKPYFQAGNPKNHRRLMFFANAAKAWPTPAKSDPNVFAGEGQRAKGKKTGTAKKAAKKKTVKKKAKKKTTKKKTKKTVKAKKAKKTKKAKKAGTPKKRNAKKTKARKSKKRS